MSGSRFRASATPSLAHFVRAAAEDVPHPTQADKTLWDATKVNGVLTGKHIDAEALALYEAAELDATAESTGVGVLGSGSDYTVFVQRTGVSICYLMSSHSRLTVHLRSLLRMAGLVALSRTPFTTTTPSSIPRDGWKCTAILDLGVTSVSYCLSLSDDGTHCAYRLRSQSTSVSRQSVSLTRPCCPSTPPTTRSS